MLDDEKLGKLKTSTSFFRSINEHNPSFAAGLLPPNSILINVGRGNLISSLTLLRALSLPNRLLGIALDVTDPEPLPDDHPLWRHPKVIITPHLSGDAEGEMERGVEVFIQNIKRMREGRGLINLVDWKKGY